MRGAQWFYSLPENDNKCAKPEKIYQDYLGAVNHGNVFSLDVGPDRSGRLRKIDVATLKAVGEYIRGERKLVAPVAITSIKASSLWDKGFKPENAIDGNPSTRWGAKDGSRSGWLEVNLGAIRTISGFKINQANLNRITLFELQVKSGTEWKTIFSGKEAPKAKENIQPVKGQHFRLNILKASDVPTISEFQLLAEAVN